MRAGSSQPCLGVVDENEQRVDRETAPGDREIRDALLAILRESHAGDDDVALLEELGLCRGEVRVDVTLVNGTLHGYEIKSDRDSLRRLVRQVALYSAVLDRATLVVGERHLLDAANVVPSWWERAEVVGTFRTVHTACSR